MFCILVVFYVIMVDFCDDFVANLDGFELWSWRLVVMGEFGLWNNFFLGLWVVSLYTGRIQRHSKRIIFNVMDILFSGFNLIIEDLMHGVL